MRTTMDAAGRIVIPKSVREGSGLSPGEVEVSLDGAGVRIEPVGSAELVEQDGLLVIAAAGDPIDDETVDAIRRADQR